MGQHRFPFRCPPRLLPQFLGSLLVAAIVVVIVARWNHSIFSMTYLYGIGIIKSDGPNLHLNFFAMEVVVLKPWPFLLNASGELGWTHCFAFVKRRCCYPPRSYLCNCQWQRSPRSWLPLLTYQHLRCCYLTWISECYCGGALSTMNILLDCLSYD